MVYNSELEGKKFPKIVKLRRVKTKRFELPPILDQILRKESIRKFHPSRYFDATIELPCSHKPKKSSSRFVSMVHNSQIPGLNFARTMLVQFIPKSLTHEDGWLRIKGEIISDLEIPQITAIKIVSEILENWLKNQEV